MSKGMKSRGHDLFLSVVNTKKELFPCSMLYKCKEYLTKDK